jgi:hypothetical protein
MPCNVKYILCIEIPRELFLGITLIISQTFIFFSMIFLDCTRHIIFNFKCNLHLKFSEVINPTSLFFLQENMVASSSCMCF